MRAGSSVRRRLAGVVAAAEHRAYHALRAAFEALERSDPRAPALLDEARAAEAAAQVARRRRDAVARMAASLPRRTGRRPREMPLLGLLRGQDASAEGGSTWP